ncbi:hypothetical protein BDW59DRAFT_146448 [Aspergillus cavernicola]|uniref:DUF1772-domain-containing protein n=1 Tax=Aspergillus cavernicola TaxID=176166 RepID=A0ABR4IC78_9EURO
MSPTIGFRMAQAIGFTGAAWLSGNIAAFSMNAVPSLLRSRKETNLPLTVLAKQWRKMYETGRRQNPPIALVTAAAFVYLAMSSPSSPPLFRAVPFSRVGLYISAAVLTLGIVPFTAIAMGNTNNTLIKVSESRGEGAAVADAEVEGLLLDWVAMNRIRSLFPLVASLIGIATASL